MTPSKNEKLVTYYKLVLYHSAYSSARNNVLVGRQRAGKKTYSWLKYDGDDEQLPYNYNGREDESLAIQILIKHKENRILQNVLENVLMGHFQKVVVQKFRAVTIIA